MKNKKDIITLLWISVAVGLASFLFFTDQKTPKNALLSIGISMLYSFPLAFGNGFMNDFLTKRFSWVDNTKMRVITGIIGTILVNVVGVLVINYINYILIFKNDPAQFFTGDMALSHWLTINIALLIAAVLHAKSFMDEWKKTSKEKVTEQKIIAGSANAQFESLKNQLDPHFLFNSLNVLDALIEENPRQAQQFTSSMSKVYRYVLDQKDKELVTVEEELDFAKTYCDLLKTRFEDAVDFQFEVEEKAKQNFVVPLSLQLLLENAIKHNFATSAKPLMIKIYSENGRLIVENNLQQRESVREREGIGLSNIVQRYSLLTKENVAIENSEEKFRVKIPMLIEKISIMNTQNVSNQENLRYEMATQKVYQMKRFYSSLISFCIVMPILFFLNWRSSSENWWALWPFGFWAFSLIIRAVKVFGIGAEWEQKQIQKYLNKN